jgi:protein TonB
MKALIVSFVTHVLGIGAVLMASVLAPEAMPKLLKKIYAPTLAAIVVPHDVPLTPATRKPTKASNTVAAATPLVEYSNPAPVVAPTGVSPESGKESFGSPAVGVVGVTNGVAAVTELSTIALPPAPATPRAPARLHSGIAAPQKTVNVPPVYPEVALRTRVEGMVIIEATIDERGTVTAAHVLRSVSLLDAAAIAAVRQWKFTPARLNGEAIPVVMTVTVNFQLH